MERMVERRKENIELWETNINSDEIGVSLWYIVQIALFSSFSIINFSNSDKV